MNKMDAKLRLVPDRVRQIDDGTSYDVVSALRNIADGIEAGSYGRVTDVALVIKSFRGNEVHMPVKHAGTGTPGDLMLMAERFRQRAGR